MSEHTAEPKNKGGRPTDYSIELAEEICDTIASSSDGIKKLCRQHEHWPSHETIYRWLRRHEEFSDRYARAKRDQVQVLVDEIVDISDDTSNDDVHDDKTGAVRPNNEWINRSRLRVDSRKWIACKLASKLYGEKIHNEHSGIDGKPIPITVEARFERIATILKQAGTRRDNAPCGDDREGAEEVETPARSADEGAV
jgi:hypothetical protein